VLRIRSVAIAFALLVAVGLDIWQAQDFLNTPSLRDFGQFYASAQAFLTGLSLYASTGTLEMATHPVIVANMNPPHWHLLVLPLASWFSAPLAAAIWLALSAVAAGAALSLVARELQLPWRRVAGLTLAAAAFGGTGSALTNGQAAFVLALPMVLAWRAARRGNAVAAGAWLGLCLTLKPFLLIFGAYYCLRRGWDVMVSAVATFALILLVGICIFGAASYGEWIATMARVHWTASPLNASLRGMFERWFTAGNPYVLPLWLQPAVVPWLWTLAVGAVCWLVLRLMVRLADIDLAWSLLIVTALVVSPLGWVYYLWVAIGPLTAVVPRLWNARDWRFEATFAAIVALCWFPRSLVLGIPNAFGTLILSSLYGWGMLLLWASLAREAWDAQADRVSDTRGVSLPAGDTVDRGRTCDDH
jgi:hypothetical protein